MTDAGTRGHGDGENRQDTRPSASVVCRLSPVVSHGFTLLEVMLAVAILALVLVSLMGLQSRSSQDVMVAERITTATLLAKRLMTQALTTGALAPAETDGEFEEEEFKDYTWKKIVAATPVPQIMEVRVAVLWKEGDREEQVELVSYE